MNTYRKHYFRDEEDNRTVVATRQTILGEYVAFLPEDDSDDYICGHGFSRLAAIADLQERLEAVQ